MFYPHTIPPLPPPTLSPSSLPNCWLRFTEHHWHYSTCATHNTGNIPCARCLFSFVFNYVLPNLKPNFCSSVFAAAPFFSLVAPSLSFFIQRRAHTSSRKWSNQQKHIKTKRITKLNQTPKANDATHRDEMEIRSGLLGNQKSHQTPENPKDHCRSTTKVASGHLRFTTSHELC